jgi:hypothetical protein
VADGVLLAESRQDRRRGVLNSFSRVLIRTRSVHSYELTRPLRVVGIDGQGTVQARRHLRPKKMLCLPGVVWILELPIEDPGPEVGERLNLYARRCERQADYLRNADWQFE